MIGRALLGLCFVTITSAAQEYPVETVVQRGHTDAIRVLNFSPDGKFLITGSDDKTLKLWDVQLLKEIRTFKGHEYAVKVAHIDRENETLISASAASFGQKDILVWDLKTGKPNKSIETGSWTFWKILKGTGEMGTQLQCLALNPDGETLAWGEDNYGVKIGSIKSKMFKSDLATNWYPNAVAFSPDGKLLVAGAKTYNKKQGTTSKEILFWNFSKEQVVKTLVTRHEEVSKLSFSKNGQFVAFQNSTLTGDTAIHDFVVYDVKQDRPHFTVTKKGQISSFAFSPRGDLMAVPVIAGTATQIEIYSMTSRSLVRKLQSDEAELFALEFSPDGRLLVTTGRKISIWNTSEWSLIDQVKPPSRIDRMEFMPTREMLVVYKQEDSALYSFNLNNLDFRGQYTSPIADFKLQDKKDGVFFLKAENQDITNYNWQGAKLERVLGPLDPLNGVLKFDLNGKYLAAMGNDVKTLLVHEWSTKKSTFLSGFRKNVTSFCLGNEVLATGDEDNKILLWDLPRMTKVAELVGHNHEIGALAISPNQSFLASSSNQNIKIWDLKTHAKVSSLMGHTADVSDLTFSPSGQSLTSVTGNVSFGGQTEIIQWDLKKQKPLFKILGNDGYVNKILYHPSEDFFLTIGNDPIIRAWDPKTGVAKFGIVPLDTDNFVIYTPDNYYMFTKGQSPPVHFVSGTKVLLLENFDLKYNRPDIILERIGSRNAKLIGAYRKVYNRRLQKLGYTESMLSGEFHTPDIEIDGKDRLPLAVEGTALTITINASDKLYPLDRLFVSANNIPLFGSAGLILPGSPKEISQKVVIPLSAGKNKITVSCLNKRGAESIKENLFVHSTAKAYKPDLYLITACGARYKVPERNLKYSVKDGKDVISVLKDNKQYGRVIVDSLFDSQATKEGFIDLKKKLMHTRVDDQVILMMAGHGILDENFEFYFATYDINAEKPATNGISYHDIEWLLDSIPARNKLVLIDACHSGEVDEAELNEAAQQYLTAQNKSRELKVQTFDKLKMNLYKHQGVDNTTLELMQEMFTDLKSGSGAVVISAAAGNSYALESDQWKNGVFTYSLKEALVNGSADYNRDGKITANELKKYVSQRVFELTAGSQKPTTRSANLEFDFVVGLR